MTFIKDMQERADKAYYGDGDKDLSEVIADTITVTVEHIEKEMGGKQKMPFIAMDPAYRDVASNVRGYNTLHQKVTKILDDVKNDV